MEKVILKTSMMKVPQLGEPTNWAQDANAMLPSHDLG